MIQNILKSKAKMNTLLDILPRDMIIEIMKFLHCKEFCQLDRAVTNKVSRLHLHDAFQNTSIKHLQITSQTIHSVNDSFAGVFFPESMITLNVMGNLRHGWDMLHIKRTQTNALQWIKNRKVNLKLILFDFCTEFDIEIFQLLSDIPSIESVDCKNCHISAYDLNILFNHIPNLKKLSFHTRLSPTFVESLNRSCTSLHTLFITFGYGSELKSLGSIIDHCQRLEVLHVRKMHTAVLPHENNMICGHSKMLLHFNCEIDGGERELETLGISQNFENLQTLVLTVPNKHVSDDFMQCVSRHLKHLRWFGLRYAKVSKRAISYLLKAQSASTASLTRLDIHCCRMNGNPFSMNSSLDLSRLEHLEFVWNNYEYPGYVYSTLRSPFTAEDVCQIIHLCPRLLLLKCSDPGPHNTSFRDSVELCASLPSRAAKLQVKYIRY